MVLMPPWRYFDRIGCRQWGLVTREQALQVMDRSTVRRYRENGLLIPLYPGVYRMVTPNELVRQQAARSGHGFRGSVTFREMLGLRLSHLGVGDSEWEDRIFRWIVDAGLEPPERQVRVTVGGGVSTPTPCAMPN